VDVTNDDMNKFEKNILGGIINSISENKFDFRGKYFSEFVSEFENSNNFFKVIKTRRGEANNYKFVLIFDNRKIAEKFINFK